ncbi:DUF4192 domain-containing protein [Tomitella biformata]|uniref:DUF4192 domain-containing protein n=1 Tax=Tomitella biformata TaxID=630403 RepID=UPI000467706E|nr:DUF4192 domain-containing protein [Tomitella biformata]
MTTSASPQDPETSAQGGGPVGGIQRTLKLHDPGELLAAIPALLGFVPEDSLVIVCLGGETDNSVEMVVRHDLVSLIAEPDRMLALAAQLQALFEEADVGTVSFAVLDSDWAAGESRAWHRELIADMGALLMAGGVQVRGALLAREIACGAPWVSVLDPRAGDIPDPMESAVAAAHVYQGRMIRDSRAELEAAIAAGPRDALAAMASHLREARAAAAVRRSLGGRLALRAELESVLTAVAGVDSGELPDDPEYARLAVSISCPEVRDALLSLVCCDQASAAERLWTLMGRALPNPERADAAALCAVSAYARGDGPFAGICVDAALDANPEHRLGLLLRQALDQGMHPDRIRTLAEVGQECAASLGVFLPVP